MQRTMVQQREIEREVRASEGQQATDTHTHSHTHTHTLTHKIKRINLAISLSRSRLDPRWGSCRWSQEERHGERKETTARASPRADAQDEGSDASDAHRVTACQVRNRV